MKTSGARYRVRGFKLQNTLVSGRRLIGVLKPIPEKSGRLLPRKLKFIPPAPPLDGIRG